MIGDGPLHAAGRLSSIPSWAEPATRLGPSLWPLWLWMWEWGQGTRQSPILSPCPFCSASQTPPSPSCSHRTGKTYSVCRCSRTLDIFQKNREKQFNLSTTLRVGVWSFVLFCCFAFTHSSARCQQSSSMGISSTHPSQFLSVTVF